MEQPSMGQHGIHRISIAKIKQLWLTNIYANFHAKLRRTFMVIVYLNEISAHV